MRTFFLNLASQEALLACVDEHQVLSIESVHARIGDHELIPLAQRVVGDAGWTFDTLDRIACVLGPGGFTSLRVAVTFANVLGDQLGIPLAGVHLSELYRVRMENGKWKMENVFWFHSTKKDQLFVRGGQWNTPTLISIDELPASPAGRNSQFTIPALPAGRRNSQFRWCGELIPEHRAMIGCDPMPLQPIEDALPSLLTSLSYEKKPLEPWYGRGW